MSAPTRLTKPQADCTPTFRASCSQANTLEGAPVCLNPDEVHDRAIRERLERILNDRYRLLDRLDRGSMSIIYAAHDLTHERLVALKVLNPDMDSPFARRRFTREIRVLAGFQHPNILPLYDSATSGELAYYVAPLVAAGSLRLRLDGERALKLHEALRIAIDIGKALDYAHEQGVLHRDVKPGNILLAADRAILADFGIASAQELTTEWQVTQTENGIPGTPLYMSPEQYADSAGLDGRSDIYSLGLVLFEMLTGELPFQHVSASTAFAWRHVSEAPLLRTIRCDAPRAVEDAIQCALRRDRAERFETCGEFVALLRAAQKLAA